MTSVQGNGPSVSDLARRVQRIEDRVDERIATTDMLRAQEKLFEARELGHITTIAALESRVKGLEEARKTDMENERQRNRMVMAALLAGLGNFIILVITLTSKGAG